MSEKEHTTTDAPLNELLHKLPDKPVASNFTSRVLQAVQHESVAAPARPAWLEWVRHPLQWMPRFAGASLALCLGLFSYQHYETNARAKMVASVVTVAQVSSLPSPELLRDFDAVRTLSDTPAPDEELLALMK